MRSGRLRGGASTLDSLIYALCDDYSRRAEIIAKGNASARSLLEMRYLNYRIFEASAEIAGEDSAHLYISEIGSNIGYAKSKEDFVSEVTYKQRKKAIKQNIAKKLYLAD